MTLKALLEEAGHAVVDSKPEVIIAEGREDARVRAHDVPTLLLTTASMVGDAVAAMRDDGVYGYIFLPFQAHEAALMVARATERERGEDAAESDGNATPPTTLEDAEWLHIRRVMVQCKHNQSKAAKVLGIGRNTLWRKLNRMKQRELDAARDRATQ